MFRTKSTNDCFIFRNLQRKNINNNNYNNLNLAIIRFVWFIKTILLLKVVNSLYIFLMSSFDTK